MLEAALQSVRDSAFEWTSSITFLDLAVATGIDQAQIARDFGSKDELAQDLILYMLDGERYGRFEQELGELPEARFDTIADLVSRWAAESDRRNRVGQDLTSEMLLWAAAGPGSPEWRALAKLQRHILDYSEEIAEQLLAVAVDNGAVRRNQLTPREFSMALTSVVEGLAIRASIGSESISPDLTERVALALGAALIGPTPETPRDQMRSVTLKPDDSQ